MTQLGGNESSRRGKTRLMLQRFADSRRVRRFSTSRAGESGRIFASERLRSFLRANAVRLPLTTIVLSALAGLFYVLPQRFDKVTPFAVGAWVMLVLMYAYHWSMAASGATQAMMGEQGEIWTDQELRSLRKRGWRVVNHVRLKPWDIDHVAIGPDGLMVIESKWTSSEMSLDGSDEWVDGWAQQAQSNSDDVKRFIGWGARRDAPIAPLVVVWGPRVRPAQEGFHRTAAGVNVIAGVHLRQALDDLGDERTARDEIERAYEKLVEQVERRDNQDLKASGRPPRTAQELINRAAGVVGAGFVGFYVLVSIARLPSWSWPIGSAVVLGVGITGVRTSRFRPWAAAWLGGSAAAFALLLGLVISQVT